MSDFHKPSTFWAYFVSFSLQAKNDAARMSQSFKSFSLRPQSAVWPEQADTMQEQDDEAISGNAGIASALLPTDNDIE